MYVIRMPIRAAACRRRRARPMRRLVCARARVSGRASASTRAAGARPLDSLLLPHHAPIGHPRRSHVRDPPPRWPPSPPRARRTMRMRLWEVMLTCVPRHARLALGNAAYVHLSIAMCQCVLTTCPIATQRSRSHTRPAPGYSNRSLRCLRLPCCSCSAWRSRRCALPPPPRERRPRLTRALRAAAP